MNPITRLVTRITEKRNSAARYRAERAELLAAQADTQQMVDAGIISTKQRDICCQWDNGTYWKTPVVHIGAAARLARLYGLKFDGGLCFGTMTAYLPRKRWSHIPENTVWVGWVQRGTFQAAVCDCLLHCFERGILTPRGDVSI